MKTETLSLEKEIKKAQEKEIPLALLYGLIFLLSGALLLLASGCSHVHLAEWQGNQRTVCGNKWSNEEDLNLEAEKACHGQAKPVGGFENRELAGYSQGFSGHMRANYRKEKCLVYECGS